MHRRVLCWAAATFCMATLLSGCAGGADAPNGGIFERAGEEVRIEQEGDMRRVVALCSQAPFNPVQIGSQLAAAGFKARGRRAGTSYKKVWGEERGPLLSWGEMTVVVYSHTPICDVKFFPGNLARNMSRVGFAELRSRGFQRIEVPTMLGLGLDYRYVRPGQRLDIKATRPVGAGEATFDIIHRTVETDPTCQNEGLSDALKVGCVSGSS